MSFYERVVSDEAFRADLRAARSWGVAPSVFVGERSAGPVWTATDTAMARALEAFEAQECPGCGGFIPETTRPESEGRWVTDVDAKCFRCVARSIGMDVSAKRYDHPEALLFGTHERT